MRHKFIVTSIASLLFITITSTTVPVFAAPNEATLSEVIQNIQEYDSKIEYNMDKLNVYKELILEKENDIKENEKELELAKVNIKEKDVQLSDRLKLIQTTGGIEATPMMYLDALLTSGNIMEAIERMYLISKICTSDKELITEAKEAEEKLEDIKDNIEKENKELQKNKEDIENEIKALEEQKAQLLEYVQENMDLLNMSTGSIIPITLPSDISEDAKELIEEAQKYLGIPYVWGGASPDGFDCSGLMQYVFNSQGIEIPRTSQEQQKFATSISIAEIKPGDLVFNKEFDSTHVGMYIGDDMYIQAPHTGDVVKISTLSTSNMKYVGRILN